MKNKLKNKYIFIPLGILIVLMIFLGGVYAATTIAGSSVTYSNSSSGLLATTVQAAIDELYTQTDIRKMGNFIGAYKYSTATSTKCITGNESTCVKSTCYKTKTSGSCPAGTIIKYKVNDTDIVTFHVMYDNGTTMTMQSQRNIVYNNHWYEAANNTYSNTSGPIVALPALESATAGWTNVNNQTYTMGTTTFKTNAYTGCSTYSSCATNTYTLASRTAKARMITIQEAKYLGCTATDKSCPIWMNNYLPQSTSYGGTINDTTDRNTGYWTMNAYPSNIYYAWFVSSHGSVQNYDAYAPFVIRAVVVGSK